MSVLSDEMSWFCNLKRRKVMKILLWEGSLFRFANCFLVHFIIICRQREFQKLLESSLKFGVCSLLFNCFGELMNYLLISNGIVISQSHPVQWLVDS